MVAQALGILRVAPREQQVPETLLVQAPPPVRYESGVMPASTRRGRPAPSVETADAPDRTPSAVGLTAREAIALFARAGLLARLQGSGLVVAQDPPAGSSIRTGSVHTLFLADSADAPAPAAGRRAEETAPPPSGP